MEDFLAQYKQSDYYTKDPDQFTQLHYAAIKNLRDIGEKLISDGAEIDAKDITCQKIKFIYLHYSNLNELKEIKLEESNATLLCSREQFKRDGRTFTIKRS